MRKAGGARGVEEPRPGRGVRVSRVGRQGEGLSLGERAALALPTQAPATVPRPRTPVRWPC